MVALSAVLLPLALGLLAWPHTKRAACLRLAAWAPLPALAAALLAWVSRRALGGAHLIARDADQRRKP